MMTTRKDFVERRRHSRAKIKGEAFVEFYKPRLFKLGKPRIAYSAAIIDISSGGLAFEYTDRHMLSADFYQLSVSTTADKIKIGALPFKAVSDFPISRLSNSKCIRRRGIKFGKLTPNKKFQLDAFIKNHTTVDTRSGIERQRTYDDMVGRRSGFDRRLSADSNYQGIEKRISGDRRKGTRKREQTRFRTKDLTFVKLNSENKEDVGELLDISKGGLSLRYFVKEEKPLDYLDLSILSSGGDLIMDKVSFRTVSHTELVHNRPFNSTVFRRYGVQFEKLTSEQTNRLDYCLLNHTLSEA